MTASQDVVVGVEGDGNSDAADTGPAPNMEVQVDDDIEEDECERFSSGSLSSGEDCNDVVGGRGVNISKIDGDDGGGELKCPQNKSGNGDGDGTAVAVAVPETVTTLPPDVIMHHNHSNGMIKRKGSRRGRRKRKSSTGVITASVAADTVDTDGEAEDRQATPTAAISTVSEESPPPAPSSPGPMNTQTLDSDTIVPDTETSIEPSTPLSFVDNTIANHSNVTNAGDGSIDNPTTAAKAGGTNTAKAALESQQVRVGNIFLVKIIIFIL